MVGDFVDAPVSKLAGAAEPIRYLKAKKGKFFVTGMSVGNEVLITHLLVLNFES